MIKICTKCKKGLTKSYFHKDPSKKDGLYSCCKVCRKIVRPVVTHKICIKCKELKIIQNNFTSQKGRICKSCKLKSKREYSKTPKKLEYRKQYRLKNKNKINKSLNKRKKQRKLEDSGYKLRENISNLIKENLKNNSLRKNSKTTNILGCSMEFFKQHIESQFLNWMSWDNYGNCENNEYNCSWHLDHIIPISSAKTKEEIILLNHWSNFQPLCSKINMVNKKNNVPNIFNIELNIYSESFNQTLPLH